MSHLDDEQLALLALGESMASVADCAHLRECAVCAAELRELTRTVTIARTAVDGAELETPPQRVWAAIAAEVGVASAAEGDDADADELAAPAGRTETDRGGHRPRRPRRRAVFALAAAIVLIAGIGLTAWGAARTSAPTVLADATLSAFPTHAGASGSADLERARDGALSLVVTTTIPPAAAGYREVWLIRGDGGALISLGVLDGSSGTFAVPADIDFGEYRLVDISAEPADGDPAHSGDSIVRGELRGT
ncbi:anti-sigma factor [Microbacterium sp.]|uniref:anti-sigma factor n=1 Tax=Microbacterium sp. TaxID=51671 RepID=UPI0028A6807F|nr:anti-sigma factor [Microbacterium sp.]